MVETSVFLMTDARHFDVTYQINPWMEPNAWASNPSGLKTAALTGSSALRTALEEIGAKVETVPAAEHLPDLVFPANAAIVLDGRALLARFRHPERQGEGARAGARDYRTAPACAAGRRRRLYLG